LERLNALGVIAIINENDVVTGCSELDTQRVFSDNDKLSALVAAGSDADGLALRVCPFQFNCSLQLLLSVVSIIS
jgi:glutamate 5-kinase